MVNPNSLISRVHPFGNRGTLTDTNLFFGRDRELKGIADKLNNGQSVSIFGQRTIGKSSLLFYMANAKERWKDWGFDEDTTVFVPIDIARETRLKGDELLTFLASEAAVRVGDHQLPPNPSQSEAHNWLSSVQAKRIIFLLDEFEFIGEIPGIEPRHFSYLRSMINLTRLVFITASRDSLYDLTAHIKVLSSPFFNIFHDVRLKHFTEEEARQMVFGRDNERQGLFTEEDFKRICEMSGCLPMVMSLICQQLFELRTGNKAVRWEVLEKSLADRTRNDYRYFWNEDLTDPDQRELLIRLGSEQGVPDSELGEDEEKQVERLEVVGLVVRTNNGKLKIVPGLRPVIEEALRKARRRNTGSLLSETYQTSQPPSVPPPAFRSGSFDEQWSQEESYRMALPAEAIQSSQANQNLQSTLISQLMEMLAGPRLDNYDGYLCAELKDSQTSEAMEWDGRNINAASGKEYQLYVWLDRQKPAGKLFDRVEINDGQKAADIKFQIAIDCDSLRFFPRQQDCLVNVGQYSSVLSFSCPVGEKKTNHQLWIQLFQKNRLIQVLPLQISVEGE